MSKKILILGVAGMLGHKLYQQFQTSYDVYATVRSSYKQYHHYGIFDETRIISGIDALNIDSVSRALADIQPDVVINCIGIIKQLNTAKDPLLSITINALFPHRLALLCSAANTRLIHISTDCVFNGKKGMYTEADPSNAEDLYGRTKFLGEVDAHNTLTLRTSIIGRELGTTSGLIEWFLSHQGGKIRGFRQAIYSGFTTEALSAIMANLIDYHPELSGVYHVSSEPINKYDLLHLVKEIYGLDIALEPYDDLVLDRSLDSSRFQKTIDFTPPSWQMMIESMAHDPTPYDEGRWV